MPKISAAAAAHRRSHILDAARQCFAEHGIHVSVDEICARAGVSKGAFYLYFSSKDAAIEALAEDHKRVITHFAKLSSPEELVSAVVELTTARTSASSRLELETWTHALKLPPLRAALQDNVNSLQHALTTGVAALGDAAGERPISPPSAVAEILTIFSLGLIASSALGTQRTRQSSERALRILVGALLGGQRRGAQRRPRLSSSAGA